jgi:hypothetical protein
MREGKTTMRRKLDSCETLLEVANGNTPENNVQHVARIKHRCPQSTAFVHLASVCSSLREKEEDIKIDGMNDDGG